MATLVDKIVQSRAGYSHLDNGMICYVHKRKISDEVKPIPEKPKALPGVKRPKGTAYFFRNAQALGRIANHIAANSNMPVIAVLFRDNDGTHSSPSDLWDQKVTSIKSGFSSVGCKTGVAMVPKPKSEAWLLCAARGFQNCQALEELSGNDGAANNVKDILAGELSNLPGKPSMTDIAESVNFELNDIDMESFRQFKSDLLAAVNLALR